MRTHGGKDPEQSRLQLTIGNLDWPRISQSVNKLRDEATCSHCPLQGSPTSNRLIAPRFMRIACSHLLFSDGSFSQDRKSTSVTIHGDAAFKMQRVGLPLHLLFPQADQLLKERSECVTLACGQRCCFSALVLFS